MTKLALLTIAALLAASGSTLAADLPVMAIPAPAAVDTSADWTGAYIGVNGGYGWGNVNYSSSALSPTAQTSGTTTGWLGGVTAGYNYQVDQFVLGIEGDIDAANISGSTGDLDTSNSPAIASSNLSWLGTVRGRVGIAAASNFLVYATGGLAVGGVNNSVTNLLHNGDNRSANGTQAGWTIGAGVEAKVADNISVKAEYLYTDLGTADYTFSNPAYVGQDVTASVHTTANIARVGLNFGF